MDLTLFKSLADKFSFISGNKINSGNDNRQYHLHLHLPDNKKIPEEQLAKASKIFKGFLTNENKKKFFGSTSQSQKNLKLIDTYHKENEGSEAKKFIEQNLPFKDKSIWYSALILKEEFSKHNNDEVNRLKKEMSASYPERGRNIANLCSAGYLESHIMPLHSYLVSEKSNEALFLKIYETIVTEFPFAVFVSQEKTLKDIKIEVEIKIELVRKYGWEKVSVHGIGENNVKKIMEIAIEIQKENKDLKNIDISSFESQGKIVTVAFNLK